MLAGSIWKRVRWRAPSPNTWRNSSPSHHTGGISMSNLETSLKEMMAIDGALGCAVVDYSSGMALGVLGGSKSLDLQVAAAGNTEVVRAKMRTIEQLGLKDAIEDI